MSTLILFAISLLDHKILEAVGAYTTNKNVSRRCWEKFRNIAEFANYSSYLTCLAVDDMLSETFRSCASQQLIFLRVFASGFEVVENLVKNDFHKFCIRNLKDCFFNYICSLEKFIRESNHAIVPTLPTEKYTEFLLRNVTKKAEEKNVAAFVLAAIAPCVKLSAYMANGKIDYNLGRRDITDTYKKWIENHFFIETVATEIENVLDELSAYLNAWQIKEIEDIYDHALKIAVEYYVALSVPRETVVPLCHALGLNNQKLTIFCNFDMTCTKFDSFYVLEKLSLQSASKSDCEQLRRSWSSRRNYYKFDVEVFEKVQQRDPGTPSDYNYLRNILNSATQIQKKENACVVESKVLRGLHLGSIKRAGQNNLRDDCRSFFRRIAKRPDVDVHIVSFCLCGDLIRSAFTSDLAISNIHSNKLLYEGSTTTGEIVTKVGSAIDKHRYFTKMLKTREKSTKHFTVYIGGKIGDLPCMLEADLGILIYPSRNISRLCHTCGIKILPLSHCVLKWQRSIALGLYTDWQPLSDTLYYASWTEVEAFFVGFEEFL